MADRNDGINYFGGKVEFTSTSSVAFNGTTSGVASASGNNAFTGDNTHTGTETFDDINLKDVTTTDYDLIIKTDDDGTPKTADRNLTIKTLDADKTLTIKENAIVEGSGIINASIYNIRDTYNCPLFYAPFDLTVTGASIISANGLGADVSNYVDISIVSLAPAVIYTQTISTSVTTIAPETELAFTLSTPASLLDIDKGTYVFLQVVETGTVSFPALYNLIKIAYTKR